jgi:hypothetical protein
VLITNKDRYGYMAVLADWLPGVMKITEILSAREFTGIRMSKRTIAATATFMFKQLAPALLFL